MNILILTTHFNTGGITSYVRTLTKGLCRDKHNVFVASSGGDCVSDLADCGARHVTLNIRTKSELHPKIYLALFPLARLIQQEGIDVIHAHTRITQVMAAWLSRMTGVPYVTTCHGYFQRRLGRRVFPCWGETVIAISEAVQEHLIEDFHLPAERIIRIENGIDIEAFAPIDDALRQKKRDEMGLGAEPILGIIARLSDVKGHDVLIAAMKKVIQKIPTAKLMIVGQGREEASLKALTKKQDLDRHVSFHRTVNRTSDILPVFDAFVMPSRQEGLGLSVMEAQASALPVIGSAVGGIPSLIEDGATGLLVSPENTNSLADAITTLLGNKEESKRMGQRARAFIKEKFSADAMREKTVAVYQQVSNKKR